RREAERVGKLAALLAERDVVTARRAACLEKAGELSTRRLELTDDWRQLWDKSGIEAGAPSEMKAWLLAHAALLRTAEELRAVLADAAAIRASVDAHRLRLLRLLAGHEAGVEASAALAVLLDRAEEVVDAAETVVLERR